MFILHSVTEYDRTGAAVCPGHWDDWVQELGNGFGLAGCGQTVISDMQGFDAYTSVVGFYSYRLDDLRHSFYPW